MSYNIDLYSSIKSTIFGQPVMTNLQIDYSILFIDFLTEQGVNYRPMFSALFIPGSVQ